jgi:hypothetical protein
MPADESGSAGTTPDTVEQMARDAIAFIGTPQTSPEEYLSVFFAGSSSSRQAGQQAMQRMYARTEDRDAAASWATRDAQQHAEFAAGVEAFLSDPGPDCP